MSKKTNVPPLSEFIDLEARRLETRRRQGFEGMEGRATVAVYNTKETGYQILTVRISEELAAKHRITEGLRMHCMIHPDQKHIALTASSNKKVGSVIFRPKGSRSLVYQTTLRRDMLEPQGAKTATLSDDKAAVVISLD